MKRNNRIVASLLLVVTIVLFALSGTSCQLIDKFLPSEEPAPEKAIVGTYVVGYVDQFDCIDSLVLYNDGTFELTQTHISCGKQTDPETHQVIAATVYAADSIVTTSTYTIDEKADGYQKVNLAAADRVIFNRVVMSGMFVKGIDSELSTFPVTYIGDDVTQISREQFMSDYGSAKTYYIVLDGNEEPTTQIVHEIG